MKNASTTGKLASFILQNALSLNLCDFITEVKNCVGEYSVEKFRNIRFSEKFLEDLAKEKKKLAEEFNENFIKTGFLAGKAVENILKSRNIKINPRELDQFLFRFFEFKEKSQENQVDFNEFLESLGHSIKETDKNKANSPSIIEETPGIKVKIMIFFNNLRKIV